MADFPIAERVTPAPRCAPAAFTLVELLTVAAIIGILLAMLMPLFATVRESARRVVCASHLRQWGTAALAHVADFSGQFPQTYGMEGSLLPDALGAIWGWPYPLMIHNEPAPYPTYGGTWRTYGTNFATWQGLGVTEQLARCPSVQQATWQPFYVPPSYFAGYGFGSLAAPDTVLQLQYCYIGGLADYPYGLPTMDIAVNAPGYSGLKPAYRMAARNDGQRLLMTDTIQIYSPLPAGEYRINHAANGITPGFQNLLFVDGRVEGRGMDKLARLEPMPAYQYSWYPGVNFYWARE